MVNDLEKITGGKKLTWKQYMKKKREYEAEMEIGADDEGNVVRAGVCKCGHKSFSHRIENHEFIRICSNCEDEIII